MGHHWARCAGAPWRFPFVSAAMSRLTKICAQNGRKSEECIRRISYHRRVSPDLWIGFDLLSQYVGSFSCMASRLLQKTLWPLAFKRTRTLVPQSSPRRESFHVSSTALRFPSTASSCRSPFADHLQAANVTILSRPQVLPKAPRSKLNHLA